MSETTTQILIAKCQNCSHINRAERTWREGTIQAGPMAGKPCRDLIGGYNIDQCEACHGLITTATKSAKTSTIRCGAKCTNATGPACSCECGGRNHGAHFTVAGQDYSA